MKHPSKNQWKKHLGAAGQYAAETVRAVGKAAEGAARVAGDAAKASAQVFLAATFGNPAEKELAIDAHNPIPDLERARKEKDDDPTPKERGGGSIPDADLAKLFRTVGTAVWKLQGRMLDPETKEPRDEFRRVWRHVEAIRDALTDIGVDIVDWTGKRYDEGMSLKVVAEEERPGTKQPDIIETLLPTIRFRKQVQLQQGEVVVSRPDTPAQGHGDPTDARNTPGDSAATSFPEGAIK